MPPEEKPVSQRQRQRLAARRRYEEHNKENGGRKVAFNPKGLKLGNALTFNFTDK